VFQNPPIFAPRRLRKLLKLREWEKRVRAFHKQMIFVPFAQARSKERSSRATGNPNHERGQGYE